MDRRKPSAKTVWLMLEGARPVELTPATPIKHHADGTIEVVGGSSWKGIATAFSRPGDGLGWRPIAELRIGAKKGATT